MESTKPKPFCFILMPFEDSFSDIYTLGIKEACNDAGAYCERVDEQIFKERILDRIYNQVSKADIIIADMTGKNPNVFYEVGYAHAIGKTTILLTQSADDIPFDLKHFPHIVYNNKIVELKKELTKRVKYHIENPDVRVENKLAIEVFIKEKNISTETVELTAKHYSQNSRSVDTLLTFYNNSNSTLLSGEFKVAIITSHDQTDLYNAKNRGINKIILPNKSTMHILPDFDTLFPSAYTSFETSIVYHHPNPDDLITIRIFTEFGTRDYNIKAKFN